MRDTLRLRTWATPLTICSFFLMAGTGVLMFFELDGGLTAVVHQWFSWLFVAGAAAHIATHLRPFQKHLASRGGKAGVATLLGMLVASYFSWGLITGPQLERPIEQALVEAPLAALANVTLTSEEVLVRRLASHGMPASGDQSVSELSRKYDVGENYLLSLVFLPQ
jgi:hypothetical protein